MMSHKSFPFPIMGLIHLTNKIEVFGSIPLHSSVNAKITLNRNYILHEKGFCFSITSELFNDHGDVLWQNESLMLKRFSSFSQENIENLTRYESKIKDSDVYDMTEISKWRMKSTLGREYAKISGDFNPIHLTSLTAFMFGFKNGSIAHGMCTKARVLADLIPQEKIGNYDGSVTKKSIIDAYVEFKTPLFLPGTVSLLHKNEVTSELNRTGSVFELKGDINGEHKPHLRGICSWDI